MNMTQTFRRFLGTSVLLAMIGFAAVAYTSIRRDVNNLRVISQDNILWTATQMEVELLRFQLSVANFGLLRTPEALDGLRERYDILLSRVGMMRTGRVGDLIRGYDVGFDSISKLLDYLTTLDAAIASLTPQDAAQTDRILAELQPFQRELRLYTLRVVRGDTAASAGVRDSIQRNAQITVITSLAAVALSLLALVLILGENRRQRQIADLSRRIADDAELSSRTQSRFLTMMSHELRNPLNGVLGPLALLGQADLSPRHRRLVQQAQQSGQSMVQMLGGLLDYGEMQDGRFVMRDEPLRLATLVGSIQSDFDALGVVNLDVRLSPEAPEMVRGDLEHLRHMFVHLTEYVLEASEPGSVAIGVSHDGKSLIGEIGFDGGVAAIDWKLDLMMGLNEIAPDQVSTEALRPLIVRGLIAAARGLLTLVDRPDGHRAIRIVIPSAAIHMEPIRVRLETRSTALAAIYQAALRSERISFIGPDEPGTVDMVLVDATTIGEEPLMARLRDRHPEALFVSLGSPQCPDAFDDVVEGPADMTRLRTRILGRFAG